jgi:hypothetical protein
MAELSRNSLKTDIKDQSIDNIRNVASVYCENYINQIGYIVWKHEMSECFSRPTYIYDWNLKGYCHFPVLCTMNRYEGN